MVLTQRLRTSPLGCDLYMEGVIWFSSYWTVYCNLTCMFAEFSMSCHVGLFIISTYPTHSVTYFSEWVHLSLPEYVMQTCPLYPVPQIHLWSQILMRL